MTKMKDIARLCNVSVATVSNVLHNKSNVSQETKEKIWRVVEELNYKPNHLAQNLKLKQTKSLGILVEDVNVFCSPEIINGITRASEERGYHILLINLRLFDKFQDTYYENEEYHELVTEGFEDLLAKQVEAIIYVSAHERALKCIPKDFPIPICIAYGYDAYRNHPSVVVDDYGGAALAIDYLIDNGHKKIGIITGKNNSIHTQSRLDGAKAALMKRGIAFTNERVVNGDWSRESGYVAAGKLLNKGITAIFAMNDIMAGGVYDKLEDEKYVVGKDISVIGYDNREISSFFRPALTTLALPLEKIGYRSCVIVLDSIRNQTENLQSDANLIIDELGRLISRDSVERFAAK